MDSGQDGGTARLTAVDGIPQDHGDFAAMPLERCVLTLAMRATELSLLKELNTCMFEMAQVCPGLLYLVLRTQQECEEEFQAAQREFAQRN